MSRSLSGDPSAGRSSHQVLAADWSSNSSGSTRPSRSSQRRSRANRSASLSFGRSYWPANRRWRSASYSATAQATEILRLRTIPIIGITKFPSASDRFLGHAPLLVPKDERDRFRQIELVEVETVFGIAQIRRVDGEPVRTERFVAGSDRRMEDKVEPLERTTRDVLGQLGKFLDRVDEMDGEEADRVAGAEHCAHVVRIMHVLEDDRQIRLATFQHLAHPLQAPLGDRPFASLHRSPPK